MKRYAAVHGHFYQPPRENPWTGEVERQPSAGSDHDWNARVARECYVPNSEARVVDVAGRIVDLVANYDWLSFNFGPTLLAWYEKAHPHAYARLIQADKDSCARLDGHGNALAQSFHHSILPLADPRDRRTEILWGLADFRRRFDRDAEGMWLPECAVDEATLAALARAGVKFAILEPHQAESVRPITGGTWRPAAELLKPGVPYHWRGPEGDEMSLFFYDGRL
ncbi:MAG: glycoside hydrolase, partial [Elusimicrobiota bacterium]